MILGVLKEPSFESRVSLLAETAAALVKKGVTVWVESNAGQRASCGDEEYRNAGAVIATRGDVMQNSDIILSIHSPFTHEAANLIDTSSLRGKILIGVYQPLFHPGLMQEWTENGFTVFSLDMLLRTTRAQSMDVLSSQANIAGYKAVLLAAQTSP